MVRNLVALAVLLGLVWAAPVRAAEDERGASIFELCAQCHGSAAHGNQLFLAPSIAGLPEWYIDAELLKFKHGIRGAHPDDVAGLRMYPMSLSLKTDGDVAAVAAYVASLPPVRPEPTLGGDPQRGKALYTPCAACHGPDAQGNKVLEAPPLNHTSDWYLLTQLEHFKAGIRGSNPADTTGMRMRPMAQILPDEQAMKDVIAYIMTLPLQGQ